MTQTMTQEAKDKLAQIPRSRCSICDTPQSYTNPISKCVECQKKFCYDHILGGQIKGIKEESIKDVCQNCKDKFHYKTL